MQILLKKIDEFIPYENNPRNNDEAVKYVAESIKQFGFKVPIIIDKDNVIVAGHTRLKAAKQLGLEEVPCIIADDLTEEQVKAFRLADNKVQEFSSFDYIQLEDELNSLLDEEQIEQIKKFDFDITEEIDWDEISDIDEYVEPSHKQFECPFCHHIDRDIHFKKVINKSGGV